MHEMNVSHSIQYILPRGMNVDSINFNHICITWLIDKSLSNFRHLKDKPVCWDLWMEVVDFCGLKWR